MNLREQVLNHKPTVEPVEAFGTTVYVREMSADEVESFYRWHAKTKDQQSGIDVMRAVVLRTLCDKQGERLLTDDEDGVLRGSPARDVRVCYDIAAPLNAIEDDDVKSAEGNSEATPPSGHDS